MKNLLLFVFSFLFISRASAQTPPTTNLHFLNGTLKDAVTGAGLHKASVSLIKQQADSTLLQTLSDSAGFFIFNNLPAGNYTLRIDFIGYPLFNKMVSVADQEPGLLLGTITMAASSKAMKAIVITTQKLLVENKIDRLVYNVEKDVTSQGGVASDILKKIPQVSVDAAGNVELLGSPSIRFLINGKPSAIFGNSVADALQSIPASQIQSIEVMSSPGAKYDATGTGGIININLKKNKTQGFSGTVNATAGTRIENGAINLNAKQNNIAVSGYFSGSKQLKAKTLNEGLRNSTDIISGDQYLLQQNGSSNFNRYGYRTGVGMDWDISPIQNLSLSLSYNNFGNHNNGTIAQNNVQKTQSGTVVLNEASVRLADSRFSNATYDMGVSYRKKLHREKEELSLSFNYSTGANNSSYSQSQRYAANDSIFSGSASKNPGKDHLSTFTIDYNVPVGNNLLLETGFKTEMETLLSDANVYSFNRASYQYLFDTRQTYSSTFKRQVYAGYVSGSYQLFKFLNVISGLRWEYTQNKAEYSNAKNTVIPDYSNLGPSITLSHNFKETQTVRFSYAYRLERPEYRDLNPFVNLTDPHNIITGNPNILPEIGNDYQLGYNQNFNGDNNLNVVLVYTYNSPDIKSYTTFYPSFKIGDSTFTNVNVTRRSNIAAETRWGLNISGAMHTHEKLTLRPGVQLYQRQTSNIYSVPVKISGFEYRFNLNTSYQFNPALVGEAFGNYRSGIKWQGRQAAFASYTIAIRQQLFKGKGSLGVVAVNAFANSFTQTTRLEGSGFTSVTSLHIPYRSFGINFLYKFGGIKISKPKEADDFLNRPPEGN